MAALNSPPFEISRPPKLSRNFQEEFQGMLNQSNVNEVNHGEFEAAADVIAQQSRRVDDASRERPEAVAIQRCRRGGKTFMLKAVASLLQERARLQQRSSQAILIMSLNGSVPHEPSREDPHQANTSRAAWELTGQSTNFHLFKRKHSNFGSLDEWLEHQCSILLLVDELNAIDPCHSRR